MILVTLLVCSAIVVLALMRLPPPATAGLSSRPDPVRGYAAALARWREFEAEDRPEVDPECRTRAFLHGERTRDALVLIHGLTNCPKQFAAFGERFRDHGWNVLIARLPHHGLANRMTTELARLRASELARFTDRVVDIAAGFGERVTVAGLSVGGVAAAWAGQERADVHRAVVIAPMFGLGVVPWALTAFVTRLLLALPNRFLWWNPALRERLNGPRHVYPRFSTRAVGEVLRLGFAVEKDAAARPPAANHLLVVNLERDTAVNNRATQQLVRSWRRAGAHVETFVFPARLRLNHDLIDPEQVDARPAVVYPELMRLIEG